MRSLPTPTVTPTVVEGQELGKPLNVKAPPFIPSPSSSPPNEPTEDFATTASSPLSDPSSTEESDQGTRSPSPQLERRHSISSICSVSFAHSTIKPTPAVVPVATTTRPGPPTKQRFTKTEWRAVETVINVLLEMKSRGEPRANSKNLFPLILAKDRMVYKNAGSRGNKFWKLIDLGVRMGWLEAGPGNAWIDVGKGWAE